MPTAPLVVAVAYDNVCTFELGCVVGLFATPPLLQLNRPWYRFAVCAEKQGPLRAAGGFHFTVPHSLRILDRADIIVVPGWRNLTKPPPAALLRRLRAAHERGARLCSVCSGVFVLAATGLLDGKMATSHWGDADTLREVYPKVEVNARELYIDHGSILTSAGSAAGLDMLLHVVRRDYGSRVANAVAQRLVIPRQREGGQAQFIPRLVPPKAGSPLSPVLEWMRANLHLRQDIPSLARRGRMSLRTFQRQFVEATGAYPTQWLTHERVALAKELLEESDIPFWKVAEKSGLGTEESFRRHFRRIVGTSPGRYRQQFGKAKLVGTARTAV